MGIAEEIQKHAIKIAELAKQRLVTLERELADAEARKAKIQRERDDARRAPERLIDFRVKVGSEYLCPRCWVEEGKRSPLAPIPSGTQDDLFTCRICGFEITIAH